MISMWVVGGCLFFTNRLQGLSLSSLETFWSDAVTSATRGALGLKETNKLSSLEFRTFASCNRVFYSTVSQQRCISMDWEVLNELNLLWFIHQLSLTIL